MLAHARVLTLVCSGVATSPQVEYKYVILEEQDWTQQVNELSEGKVEYTYRIEPDSRQVHVVG